MNPKRTFLAASLASALVPAIPALASPPEVAAVCPDGTLAMPREVARSQLKHKFGEQPVAHGVTGEGALMQVYASRKTYTWTILMTNGDGRSCVIGVGESFEALDGLETEVSADAPAHYLPIDHAVEPAMMPAH